MISPYSSARYDNSTVRKLIFMIGHFPFSVLISRSQYRTIAYCPLAVTQYGTNFTGSDRLYGHMDNGNPFLGALEDGSVTAIFLGPNGYVSPHDYISRQYPTWNYSFVEVNGTSALVRDEGQKKWLMVDFINRFEGEPQDCVDITSVEFHSMLKNITFFTIDIESISGRFKYSQEKSENDRLKAADRLRERISSTLNSTMSVLADLT